MMVGYNFEREHSFLCDVVVVLIIATVVLTVLGVLVHAWTNRKGEMLFRW